MPKVLGIHSNIDGEATHSGKSSIAELTAGHAWISVTDHGIVTTYGLWPDTHPAVEDNGPGTDIRKGIEERYHPGRHNRYYRLSEHQDLLLTNLLTRNVTWRYTNNCSSWASEVVYRVTGKDVDADDWFGIETPRKLAITIKKLEKKSPTSVAEPMVLTDRAGSSFTRLFN